MLNDNTPVRIDSRVNARKLGTLKAGETVEVVKEHMGWLRIQAPDSVPYFIGTKYVRHLRDLELDALVDEALVVCKRAAQQQHDLLRR